MPQSEYWFIFQNEHLLLVKNTKENLVPNALAIADLKKYLIRQHKLAFSDNYTIYCAELQPTVTLPDNIEAYPIRIALELLGNEWYSSATKAFSIINWDKNHQFCGRCGISTNHVPGTFERKCPTCSLVVYPRISPSIIVLIQRDKQILMARSPHFIPGAYGLIAGFVEAGETVEDAVHREVREEVGIKITNLRYFGSQAWPFPDSLMLAFRADYASGEIRIDHTEIENAGWYDIDHLPARTASSISVARKLIDHFIAEQRDS